MQKVRGCASWQLFVTLKWKKQAVYESSTTTRRESRIQFRTYSETSKSESRKVHTKVKQKLKNKTDFANRLPRPTETVEKTQMSWENWNPITNNFYRIKFCYKNSILRSAPNLVLKFIRVYKYTLPHSIYIFCKLIKIYLVTKKKTTIDKTKSNQRPENPEKRET